MGREKPALRMQAVSHPSPGSLECQAILDRRNSPSLLTWAAVCVRKQLNACTKRCKLFCLSPHVEKLQLLSRAVQFGRECGARSKEMAHLLKVNEALESAECCWGVGAHRSGSPWAALQSAGHSSQFQARSRPPDPHSEGRDREDENTASEISVKDSYYPAPDGTSCTPGPTLNGCSSCQICT